MVQSGGVSLRPLTRDDAAAAARFVLMATFPPDTKPPADALDIPQVRRWLEGWGAELGVGWEDRGELIGAAWARHVKPVLACDKATGQALPEVIISVAGAEHGAGVGGKLMEGLLMRASAAGCPGLSLTVSERNPVAVRLYEKVGFTHHGRTATGLLLMVWLSRDYVPRQ